jgi:SAM-dependent methyltransferase
VRERQKQGSSVAALFDDKSSRWSEKYGPGGALRERLVTFERALSERLSSPARIVELGCGTGDLAAHLSARGHRVTAFDISPGMLEQASQRHGALPITWTRLAPDWQQLPLSDGGADAVVASSVFEYLPDPLHVARECARVLKPGGHLLCTVPNPVARVRKAEALLQPLAQRLANVPLPRRVGRHVDYLRLSQQRHTPDAWGRLFQGTGLVPADRFVTGGSEDALVMLAFVRR